MEDEMAAPTSSRPQLELDPACEKLLANAQDAAVESLVDALHEEFSIHRGKPREETTRVVRSALETYLRGMKDFASLSTTVPEACKANAPWTTLTTPGTIAYFSIYRDRVIDILLAALKDGVSGAADAIRIANAVADRMLLLLA